MKVVIVSKALISAVYRKKLVELARLGPEVVAVVPPMWREGGDHQLETSGDHEYRLIVSPLRFNGHFHLHYYPELAGILRSEEPDVLHMDEEAYNLSTYLAMRPATGLRIPMLFFSWQNIPRRYPLPFRWMEQRVFAGSAGALAGTPSAAQVLVSKGYHGHVSVAPQFGIDPEVFTPIARPSDTFRIGFLNRLVAGKAPMLAIQALADLPRGVELEFVGDGPLRHDLEGKTASLGLQDRVRFRHRLPSQDLPELMRSLQVVILPSITTPSWKEQFGRVLVEAMASGVPVVGSDSGEIPSVIGDAGLIVPEGDPAALSAALQRLYDDQSLRAELSTRGRERAISRFSNAHIARLTLDAYQLALSVDRTLP
ncbi:MAG: glycosyltransferase family 4 protein [Chloroflexota bacterium]